MRRTLGGGFFWEGFSFLCDGGGGAGWSGVGWGGGCDCYWQWGEVEGEMWLLGWVRAVDDGG